MSEVAHFSIRYTRLLAPDGQAVGELPPFARSGETLAALYQGMLQARAFDTRAVNLQRTGQLGTYASALGQEAIGVGVASAMLADDVLLPSFREHAAQLTRGVTMAELLRYWGGDERGSDFAGPREDFPVSVTVGGHAPHAVGVALAFRLRGETRAAVCLFGDGATSKGDVYEAMNLAAAWSLPVVFVVSNNQWAISTPREQQTHAETLAQKAIAAGMPGEQVDGNDVIAVRAVTEAALTAARAGSGPCLIEALTYRLADHTTADDATRYRDADAVSRHWAEDPLVRLRRYLTAIHGWDRASEEAAIHTADAAVEVAVADYLATPPAPAEAMFDYLHATLPAELASQREALAARNPATRQRLAQSTGRGARPAGWNAPSGPTTGAEDTHG